MTSTCVVVHQYDEEMRNDSHNGMVISSTVLAIVGVQFLYNCYTMYKQYRTRVTARKDLTSIVPPLGSTSSSSV
jgi:hypothetical protein